MIIDDKILKQSPLAEGGEGILYEDNSNGTIIKIYKDIVNKKEKQIKVEKLIKMDLPSNVIKPIELVFDRKNKFIGYVMNKVDGEEFKKLGNKKFVKINNISIKDLVKMLVEIKDTLTELHKQNIIISDFNDNNILFDKNYNVYFIDVDSWTIDKIKCTVCMDTFKDPLLVGNSFSNLTDYYAYAIIVFKTMTRIHPFGGTMNPDMSILDRMKKMISVIDNPKVTIPKTITKWNYISPKLIKELKEIFESKKRYLISNIDDFYLNLKLCTGHNDFYYSKFTICPVCNSNVKLVEKPQQVAGSSGIPFMLLFSKDDIKTILNFNSYLNLKNKIVNRFTNKEVKYEKGKNIYFSKDGNIVYFVSGNLIKIVFNNKEYEFEKTNKSNVIVKDNVIYYINKNNSLIELTITNKGNISRSISKVSFNCYFDIKDKDSYFICNVYDNMLILNIDGHMVKLDEKYNIQNYGIHYDETTKRWLFIIEDDKGIFTTFVYDKNIQKYKTDTIKYSTNIGNICFSNKIIFKPGDKIIRGFSYDKNIYKDFQCDVVNEDSKLMREGNKFIVINEKEIYKVG